MLLPPPPQRTQQPSIDWLSPLKLAYTYTQLLKTWTLPTHLQAQGSSCALEQGSQQQAPCSTTEAPAGGASSEAAAHPRPNPFYFSQAHQHAPCLRSSLDISQFATMPPCSRDDSTPPPPAGGHGHTTTLPAEHDVHHPLDHPPVLARASSYKRGLRRFRDNAVAACCSAATACHGAAEPEPGGQRPQQPAETRHGGTAAAPAAAAAAAGAQPPRRRNPPQRSATIGAVEQGAEAGTAGAAGGMEGRVARLLLFTHSSEVELSFQRAATLHFKSSRSSNNDPASRQAGGAVAAPCGAPCAPACAGVVQARGQIQGWRVPGRDGRNGGRDSSNANNDGQWAGQRNGTANSRSGGGGGGEQQEGAGLLGSSPDGSVLDMYLGVVQAMGVRPT